VLDQADFVASTTGIIQRAIEHADRPAIIATEEGVFHAIRQKAPDKVLIPAPGGADESCSCSQCPFMRLNTLEKLYLCLRDLTPRVRVETSIAQRALIPIERMLALS
jgi:quinolinate synthase